MVWSGGTTGRSGRYSMAGDGDGDVGGVACACGGECQCVLIVIMEKRSEWLGGWKERMDQRNEAADMMQDRCNGFSGQALHHLNASEACQRALEPLPGRLLHSP
jgi:hypothetical protein